MLLVGTAQYCLNGRHQTENQRISKVTKLRATYTPAIVTAMRDGRSAVVHEYMMRIAAFKSQTQIICSCSAITLGFDPYTLVRNSSGGHVVITVPGAMRLLLLFCTICIRAMSAVRVIWND
jgi:hypothetical protein